MASGRQWNRPDFFPMWESWDLHLSLENPAGRGCRIEKYCWTGMPWIWTCLPPVHLPLWFLLFSIHLNSFHYSSLFSVSPISNYCALPEIWKHVDWTGFFFSCDLPWAGETFDQTARNKEKKGEETFSVGEVRRRGDMPCLAFSHMGHGKTGNDVSLDCKYLPISAYLPPPSPPLLPFLLIDMSSIPNTTTNHPLQFYLHSPLFTH